MALQVSKSKSADLKIAWPVKTREIHDHHINSSIWNQFKFRDNDIVIVTPGKSGTTWTQQIVAQLIFNGAEHIDLHALSPWFDLRIVPPMKRKP
jgi:aryl sulfotransferase